MRTGEKVVGAEIVQRNLLFLFGSLVLTNFPLVPPKNFSLFLVSVGRFFVVLPWQRKRLELRSFMKVCRRKCREASAFGGCLVATPNKVVNVAWFY